MFTCLCICTCLCIVMWIRPAGDGRIPVEMQERLLGTSNVLHFTPTPHPHFLLFDTIMYISWTLCRYRRVAESDRRRNLRYAHVEVECTRWYIALHGQGIHRLRFCTGVACNVHFDNIQYHCHSHTYTSNITWLQSKSSQVGSSSQHRSSHSLTSSLTIATPLSTCMGIQNHQCCRFLEFLSLSVFKSSISNFCCTKTRLFKYELKSRVVWTS
jgi:hypothetical protein